MQDLGGPATPKEKDKAAGGFLKITDKESIKKNRKAFLQSAKHSNSSLNLQTDHRKAIIATDSEVIKEIRKLEDLAQVDQKKFKEKYIRFLRYNEQNTLQLRRRLEDPDLDLPLTMQIKNQQDIIAEEKYQDERHMWKKAYDEEVKKRKLMEIVKKEVAAQMAAGQKQKTKMDKKVEKTRLTLAD